jgi:hypothetical protein
MPGIPNYILIRPDEPPQPAVYTVLVVRDAGPVALLDEHGWGVALGSTSRGVFVAQLWPETDAGTRASGTFDPREEQWSHAVVTAKSGQSNGQQSSVAWVTSLSEDKRWRLEELAIIEVEMLIDLVWDLRNRDPNDESWSEDLSEMRRRYNDLGLVQGLLKQAGAGARVVDARALLDETVESLRIGLESDDAKRSVLTVPVATHERVRKAVEFFHRITRISDFTSAPQVMEAGDRPRENPTYEGPFTTGDVSVFIRKVHDRVLVTSCDRAGESAAGIVIRLLYVHGASGEKVECASSVTDLRGDAHLLLPQEFGRPGVRDYYEVAVGIPAGL